MLLWPCFALPSDVMIALYCSVTNINQYLLTWLCLEHFLCTKPIIVFSSLYFSVHKGTWPDCHRYFHGTLNSYKLQVLSETISPFKLKIKSEPLHRGLNVNRWREMEKPDRHTSPSLLFIYFLFVCLFFKPVLNNMHSSSWQRECLSPGCAHRLPVINSHWGGLFWGG